MSLYTFRRRVTQETHVLGRWLLLHLTFSKQSKLTRWVQSLTLKKAIFDFL